MKSAKTLYSRAGVTVLFLNAVRNIRQLVLKLYKNKHLSTKSFCTRSKTLIASVICIIHDTMRGLFRLKPTIRNWFVLNCNGYEGIFTSVTLHLHMRGGGGLSDIGVVAHES